MALDLTVEYRDVIERVAQGMGMPASVVMELLALEPLHQNLHAWGARPALRREIVAIVDRAIAAGMVAGEAG